MAANTNKLHPDKSGYAGSYFRAAEGASPFEAWLAEMLDHAAATEKPYGWEHPMTFTNWVTTDVLTHPEEPLFTEDMVSVDATHIEPVRWEAGYFAAYHVYPYYPDLFRYEKSLQTAANSKGETDSYLAYLRKLKEHHKGMPLMVTEYGVPSSAGMSHVGPLNRSQGAHNETQQGQIDADLTRTIHDEGYAGAILFMWQDEWFKKTWNTMRMELPADRRAYWLNVLTNEKLFGVLGMYPGKENVLVMDGKDTDWNKLPKKEKRQMTSGVPGIREWQISHDEAYVYMSLRLDHAFDPERETVHIGADILPGGNKHGPELPGKVLDEGLETLISIGKDEETEVRIAANYDLEERLYGYVYGMVDMTAEELQDDSGIFHSWHLPVSLKMEQPDTKFAHPYEHTKVGGLPRGTTNPKDPSYDSLAMWQYNGDFIELRIPWMLLGLADPSSLQAVAYTITKKDFDTAPIDGIRFVPWIVQKDSGRTLGLDDPSGVYPVTRAAKYVWSKWDTVHYVERLKRSYYSMQALFQELKEKPKTGE